MLEELKILLVKLGSEQNNWSEEEILAAQHIFGNYALERIVVLAARNESLLPIIEHCIRNGGNPDFVIHERDEILNLLNMAAIGDALNVINYLLDNNIFTVDQRAFKDSRIPFHSAVQWNNIEAAKLFLKRGADMHAEFEDIEVRTALHDVFDARYYLDNELDYIEMSKFLVRFGIRILDDIDMLCSDSLVQHHPTKGLLKICYSL